MHQNLAGNRCNGAHRDLLIDGLRRMFGEFNEEMLQRVLPHVEWVELSSGEILFHQGERDESVYFVISGRLRAHSVGAEGDHRSFGEIGRGESVGELAFFSNEPRTGTVMAVRDSVLARFRSAVFTELLIAYPLISLNMTRLIIERLKRASQGRVHPAAPAAFGITAITAGVDLPGFARRLAAELGAHGKTIIVTAAQLGEWLGDSEAAQAPMNDLVHSRRVAAKLEEIERDHRFVLLVADAHASEWTRRSLRHCDRILLVADADGDGEPHPIEQACLAAEVDKGEISRTLVLLHPGDRRMPTGTRRWFAGRTLENHVHLRAGNEKDWSRLGRILGGRAVGLVLSGGGARGFAHLGVMQALEEAGMPFDLVGGASIGSAMAAYAAMDLPMRTVIELARQAFRLNPTGDFNLVPMISLIAGRRLRRILDAGVFAACGDQVDIEDLWKGFFCVSSNYSAACESVLERGPLSKSLRASVAIPGALPPVVIDGDLHIDGGTFNNFPTDVMDRFGAARIVGVNLLRDRGVKYAFDELPGAMTLLRDKLIGRRHRLPSLMSLMLNASMMNSYARLKESQRFVDLYFAPEVHRYGMLDWTQFDRLVQAGYDYARQVIDTSGADTLRAWQ